MEDSTRMINNSNDYDDNASSSSSSFIDLAEERMGDEDDEDGSSIMEEGAAGGMDDAFEIQAKADEWMDVTPKEELLQNELNRLKDAFKKCSTQLDSSRLENELLKVQQKELDDENQQLHDQKYKLRHSLDELHRTSTNEVEDCKQTSKKIIHDLEIRIDQLQETVTMTNSTNVSLQKELVTNQTAHETIVSNLQKELSTHTKEHNRSVSNYQGETKRLERELKAIQTDRNTHRETAVKFAEDLRKTRDAGRQLRIDLEAARAQIGTHEKQLKDSKITTGSIATLAEDLKLEKHTLERKLTKSQQSERAANVQLQHTTEEVSVLKERLSEMEQFHTVRNNKLETELQERKHDLDGSNKSIEFLQIVLKESEKRVVEVSSELEKLQEEKQDLVDQATQTRRSDEEELEQLGTEMTETFDKLACMHADFDKVTNLSKKLSSERDELKHHLMLAEQGRRELLDQKRNLEERLSETESLLEETMVSQQAQQQHWTTATTGSITVLERQLIEQKQMYEDRLQAIHSILGLKFTTAVQTQVEEIHSKAIAMKMPESFRVPLLYPVKTV